jgi:hypothetical protein
MRANHRTARRHSRRYCGRDCSERRSKALGASRKAGAVSYDDIPPRRAGEAPRGQAHPGMNASPVAWRLSLPRMAELPHLIAKGSGRTRLASAAASVFEPVQPELARITSGACLDDASLAEPFRQESVVGAAPLHSAPPPYLPFFNLPFERETNSMDSLREQSLVCARLRRDVHIETSRGKPFGLFRLFVFGGFLRLSAMNG